MQMRKTMIAAAVLATGMAAGGWVAAHPGGQGADGGCQREMSAGGADAPRHRHGAMHGERHARMEGHRHGGMQGGMGPMPGGMGMQHGMGPMHRAPDTPAPAAKP